MNKETIEGPNGPAGPAFVLPQDSRIPGDGLVQFYRGLLSMIEDEKESA